MKIGCLGIAAVVSATCFLSTQAWAQVNCDTTVTQDLDLPGGQTRKCGTHYYNTLRVAGTIKVEERDAAIIGTGWLHIKANRIEITASGIVDAISSGFRGSAEMSAPDRGPAPGGTPAGVFMMMAAAGGGGAQAGNGGQGTNTGCGPIIGGEGGVAYADPTDYPNKELLMGSAGGASLSASNSYIGRGGHGGGVVILEAQSILIDGTLVVNGDLGQTTQGAAPGGGGAGAIVILSDQLELGSTAKLDAIGGAGGVPASSTLVGGGGGGGLVMVSATGDMTAALNMRASVDGGTSEGTCCTGSPSACGAPGTIVQTSISPPCIDADGDMSLSANCANNPGDDCHDGNTEVNPSAPEKCDGLDNNCDQQVDEDPDGILCSPGTICGPECDMNGENCQTKCIEDLGAETSAAAGPQGVYIELGGGLCTTGRPRDGGRAPLWLAAALYAALLVRRRYR